jgi:Tol biopolymer transport system component
MQNQIKLLLGIAVILGATALFFVFSRGTYEDAVDCVLSDVRWDYNDIHWSADGETVVIFAFGRTPQTIIPQTVVIPVDGGDVVRLDTVDIQATQADYDLILNPRRGWNAEQTQYAFGEQVDGSRQIFVTDTSGEDVRQLTTSTFDVGKPAWSPDGTMIAYVANRSQANATGDTDSTWEIAVIDADGTNAQALLVVEREPEIRWTPDSTSILFTAEGDTYQLDVASGESTFFLDGRFPTWSPEGERMVYLSSDGCDPTVQLADAEGNDAQTLTVLTQSSR